MPNGTSRQRSAGDQEELARKRTLETQRNEARKEKDGRDRSTQPVEDIQGGVQVKNLQTGAVDAPTQDTQQPQESVTRQNQRKPQEMEAKIKQARQKERQGNIKDQVKGIIGLTSNTSQEGQQGEGLRLYPIPMLFLAVTMDLLDAVGGFLDETMITAVLRIALEITASGMLWLMLWPQTKKGQRSGAKYLAAAVIDLIPILTFLPWETVVLYIIDKQKKGEGGLAIKAAQKLNNNQQT